MIHTEDVTRNALSSHQPLTPEKIAFAIAMYDAIAEDDPTGCLPVWIEQALDLCEDKYHIEFVEKQIDEVCEAIKNDYRDNSEVGMAEMLIGYRGEKDIPENEKYITIRYFHVDIISVVLGNVGLVNFPNFKGENFKIEACSYKII